MFPGIVAGGMRGGVFDPLSLFASGEKGFHLGCVHESVLKNQSAITGSDLLSGGTWSVNYPDRVTVTGSGTIEFHDEVGDAEVLVVTSVDTEEDTTYMLQFEASHSSGSFQVTIGSTSIATIDGSETTYLPFVAPSGSSTAISISCTGGTCLFSGVQVHEMQLTDLNLFQDADGRIPATRAGNAIGGVRDQSPNGNNFQHSFPTSGASLATDGSRYYLHNSSIASNTSMRSINDVDLNVESVTVCVAFSHGFPLQAGNTVASIFNFGQPGLDPGFGFKYGETSEVWSSGSILSAVDYVTPLDESPHVFTLEASIPDDLLEATFDSLPNESSVDDQGTGTFGSRIFYIGPQSGLSERFLGRMYTLPTVVGRQLSTKELSNLRCWHQHRTQPSLL